MHAAEARLAPQAEGVPPSALVSDLIRAWPAHQPFSAQRILWEHPELARRESLVLDLASEEYRRRTAAGEALGITEFVQQYPGLSADLRRLILIDQLADPLRVLEPQWPVEGDVVDRFELQEVLGRGAQSRVFLAADLSLDRRAVVLKFVPLGSSEAVLLARTVHHHVMPVLHVSNLDTRGLTAICMPFVGRATLCHVSSHLAHHAPRQRTTARLIEAFLAAGWLDPAAPAVQRLRKRSEPAVEFVLRMGVALAEACAAAHDRGVYHRDIKPSNVLISFEGEPLLLDFNLAQAAEICGNEGGTIPYMPPERLTALLAPHEPALEATAASDVFSLGATLFEVLAGQPPFGLPDKCQSREELVASLLARHRAGPTPLGVLNPCVNRSLGRLVAATLHPNPQARPQSMHELAAALRAELRMPYRTVRSVRCRPIRALVGAAAATALVTAGMSVGAWAWGQVHAVGAPAVERDVKSLETLGLQRLQAGQPGEALALFRQAFEAQPTGRLASLTAVALLRDGHLPATAQYYFSRTEQLGYSSVEHENNRAVCELRLGNIDAAHERLTRLLETAPPKVLPTVLANWAEAEGLQSAHQRRAPNLDVVHQAFRRTTPSPWHHWQLAQLCALAERKADVAAEQKQLREELYVAAQHAAVGGTSRRALSEVAGIIPGLRSDARWQAILRSAPAIETTPTFEPTLIPR